MKLRIILQMLFAVGLLAGAGALYWSNSNLKTEVAQLRASNEELQQSNATAEETNRVHAQTVSAELARLRKESEELLSLRNEVHQLREAKQQLSQQVQAAQSQAQTAQAQVVELRQSATAAAAAAVPVGQPNAVQPLAPGYVVQPAVTAEQAKLNACLNNLRQIDGAEQQWALENKKEVNAPVTEADIVPYLKDNKMPVCPSGGTYRLNGLAEVPSCSIPGHALPKEASQ